MINKPNYLMNYLLIYFKFIQFVGEVHGYFMPSFVTYILIRRANNIFKLSSYMCAKYNRWFK